jgi:hypothetical protein
MSRAAASKSLWMALAVALCACGTELRSPVCEPGVIDLPTGAAGRYRYVIPQASPRYSGAMASLATTDVAIEPRGDRVAIIVDGAETLAKSVGRAHALAEDDTAWLTDEMAICAIDGVHYAQTSNSDGTYLLSRLDVLEKGLSFTGLAFDPDQIHADPHRFGWYAKPTLEKSETITWNFYEPTIIVDNRGVTGDRLRELLSLAKPTGVALMLTRVEGDLTKKRPARGRRVMLAFPRR